MLISLFVFLHVFQSVCAWFSARVREGTFSLRRDGQIDGGELSYCQVYQCAGASGAYSSCSSEQSVSRHVAHTFVASGGAHFTGSPPRPITCCSAFSSSPRLPGLPALGDGSRAHVAPRLPFKELREA